MTYTEMVVASSIFDPVAPNARAISDLFVILLVVAAAIFLLVTSLLLYAVLRFRARPGTPEPDQQSDNAKLEIGWTAAPALLLLIVFGLTVHAMREAEPSSARGGPDVVVIGHQWWWEIRYPRTGAITANEIHLPVGKRVLVALQSADVVHNLWLPQLGGKMQMIPGQTDYMWLEADAPGTYLGTCSEFCGSEHAWMLLQAVVQPTAQFDAWQRLQLRPAARPRAGTVVLRRDGQSVAGDPARGLALFAGLSCASCHAISGTAYQAVIGPSLTHMGGRQTLAAGRLTNTLANMEAWLRDPQALKPGAHMPNVNLDQSQIRDLTVYLEGLP